MGKKKVHFQGQVVRRGKPMPYCRWLFGYSTAVGTEFEITSDWEKVTCKTCIKKKGKQ